MSDNTKIEWTDATWNPITGCSVESAGCKHCYAMKLAGTRLKHHPSRAGLTTMTSAGPVWNGEVRLNREWLTQPIQWTRQRQIFVCAHSDLFHPNVPDEWIDTVIGIAWACLYGRKGEPGHIFQILTKRAKRMSEYFSIDRRESWARAAIHYGGGIDPDGLYDQTMEEAQRPHPRIWLGVSVEDQKAADERIPALLRTPAAVRWVSAEPLIGPVDLDRIVIKKAQYPERGQPPVSIDALKGYHAGIDWVVVGGESGQNARPMHPEWARSLRDQCAAANVPFLFKQWGEWAPGENVTMHSGSVETAKWFNNKWQISAENLADDGGHRDDEPDLYRIGKKIAGRLLDGIEHNGYPVA